MRERELDIIVENVLNVAPLFRRSFRSIDFDLVAEGISHSHIMVMRMLEEHERLSVSAIGDKQFISRPQMTHIIDKLVSLGIVERTANEDDRRVINVILTDRGRDVIKKCDALVKQSIRESLSSLDDKDIEELSALSKISDIGLKLR